MFSEHFFVLFLILLASAGYVSTQGLQTVPSPREGLEALLSFISPEKRKEFLQISPFLHAGVVPSIAWLLIGCRLGRHIGVTHQHFQITTVRLPLPVNTKQTYRASSAPLVFLFTVLYI